MFSTKLEVLVNLGETPDQKILEKTINELKSQDGVKQAEFKNGAFVVDTVLPSSVVLDMVSRSSGKRAVLQGFGDTQSAVAMISSPDSSILGVIRLQQQGAALAADGSVDGLPPGKHGLHLREAGDLSQGCAGLGGHYNPAGAPHGAPDSEHRHAGDLGNIEADERGRATFRIVGHGVTIAEIIGRSIAITERADDLGRGSSPASKIDGDSGPPIACGIIARSAGVFENPKRICACDGVVVWDERDRPLAGKGRRVDSCCKKDGDKKGEQKPCCKV
ncbi:copper chaperone for superoxide dismutase-like [Choristoneura fumiferana]|uniref:copper chaperone for superoxide dismutase-like n=1 Tax=Choristoneura fumiferana TaxID=7141 RepID=UPI003D15951C